MDQTKTVTIHAEGKEALLRVEPGQLVFESVLVGNTIQKSLTIYNPGNCQVKYFIHFTSKNHTSQQRVLSLGIPSFI